MCIRDRSTLAWAAASWSSGVWLEVPDFEDELAYGSWLFAQANPAPNTATEVGIRVRAATRRAAVVGSVIGVGSVLGVSLAGPLRCGGGSSRGRGLDSRRGDLRGVRGPRRHRNLLLRQL